MSTLTETQKHLLFSFQARIAKQMLLLCQNKNHELLPSLRQNQSHSISDIGCAELAAASLKTELLKLFKCPDSAEEVGLT